MLYTTGAEFGVTVVGLTAEGVRGKSAAKLTVLDPLKTACRAALQAYRQTLQTRYGDLLNLRVYTVVSLGFERLFWQEVV